MNPITRPAMNMVMIMAVKSLSLAIDCLTFAALPRPYDGLIILEVDLSHDVMSCCWLIAQLTVDSVKEWHIF